MLSPTLSPTKKRKKVKNECSGAPVRAAKGRGGGKRSGERRDALEICPRSLEPDRGTGVALDWGGGRVGIQNGKSTGAGNRRLT